MVSRNTIRVDELREALVIRTDPSNNLLLSNFFENIEMSQR